MTAFDPLDHWFEKGFRVRKQPVRRARQDVIRKRAGAPTTSTAGVRFSSHAKTSNIRSVIRRAPEVMVKITGSSCGLASAKSHIDYISRNGSVELTDEQGTTLTGRDDLKALQKHLKAAQIPKESNRREFLHVLFSMPPGTPAEAVREAVLNFCQEEFANRQYVAALHDDTDHTHVHVCVCTRDIDRANAPRLSPRKADLFRWRQGFADKLRALGVDAAASERRHRFQHQRPEHSVVRQIRADNPYSAVYNERRARTKAEQAAIKAALNPQRAFVGPPQPPRIPRVIQAQKAELQAALASGIRPLNPAQEKIENTRTSTLAIWQEVHRRLHDNNQTELAQEVKALMYQGELPARSRAQELFDAAVSHRQIQDQDQDKNKNTAPEQSL